MASMNVLKRSLASNLRRYVSPFRSSAISNSVWRSFNSSAQLREIDEEEQCFDPDRRSERFVSRLSSPYAITDVFDPFFPTRSLSQVLNLMDQLADNPFSVASRGNLSGVKKEWYAREDNDALHLRFDMPGLGKENVTVSTEQNTLVVKGEGSKESEDEDACRKYGSRIDLPAKLYRMDQIKAEMKNGVLKVVVPKVKERKDVFKVQID